jgi:hypothetical protein
MFISQLSFGDWVGNQNKGCLEQVPNWAEVETVIKELDDHRKTLVTLEADGETHMAVGGGTNKYVVYFTFDNETFHYLVDPSKSDVDETLTVGGQEGFYPAKLCVDIDSALKAAKTFAELGTMDNLPAQHLRWRLIALAGA